MSEKRITFNKNLRTLRKKMGYTRAHLAEILSYSEKAIEKWESGFSIPPVATICRLTELFGVTSDALLFGRDLEPEYFLGIDGGGTKTDFLLTDTNYNVVRQMTLGSSNPVDIGIANTEKVLGEGIDKICSGIDIRSISVFAGIAGGTTGDNKLQINKFLSQYAFYAYANGSDIENALEVALHGSDGMVIILGTGIIAFVQKNGIRQRIGGWGYHIDKGGSGYNFGSDALDCALKNIDGRGGSETIKNLISDKLQRPIPDSIQEIYKGSKAYIASFANTVFEAYKMGDREAERIIKRNSSEISQIIEAGYKSLGDKSVKSYICGGLCHYGEMLIPFIKEGLSADFNIEILNEPIINGAVQLAGKAKQ